MRQHMSKTSTGKHTRSFSQLIQTIPIGLDIIYFNKSADMPKR